MQPNPVALEGRRRRRSWRERLTAFERALNHRLCCSVYPRIPGLAVPYTRQLRRSLETVDLQVAIPSLPSVFDGTTVALITDVHAGPFLRPEGLAATFAALGRPDLILLGGDFATGRVADVEDSAGAFERLGAPLGVYGVLGNHDHYVGDVARLRRVIESCGVRLLVNDAVRLEREGRGLVVAGVDDLKAGKPDLAGTLACARSLGDGAPPAILLTHHPDLFPLAVADGVPLVLAGHTHGGQIRLPLVPAVRVSRLGYLEGVYHRGNSRLIVSRGIGATGLPFRFRCRPQLIRLTLGTAATPAPQEN